MGCGQSSSTKIIKASTVEVNPKDEGNAWAQMDKKKVDNNQNNQWNVGKNQSPVNPKVKHATTDRLEEIKEPTEDRQEYQKELQKQKMRRQQTEHLFAKYGKENPDMIAEKSKEILNRIDQGSIKKHKLSHIENDKVRKMPTVNLDTLDKYSKPGSPSKHKKAISIGNKYSPDYSERKSYNANTTVKTSLPGPAAAIVTMNVVNYNDYDTSSQGKNSRMSRRSKTIVDDGALTSRRQDLNHLLEDLDDMRDTSDNNKPTVVKQTTAVNVENGGYSSPTRIKATYYSDEQPQNLNKQDSNSGNFNQDNGGFGGHQIKQDLDNNQLQDLDLSNDYGVSNTKVNQGGAIHIQENHYGEDERNDFGYNDYSNHLDGTPVLSPNVNQATPAPMDEPSETPKQFNMNDFMDDDNFGSSNKPQDNDIKVKNGLQHDLDDMLHDISF